MFFDEPRHKAPFTDFCIKLMKKYLIKHAK